MEMEPTADVASDEPPKQRLPDAIASHANASQFMPNGVPLRSDVLTLEYRPGKPLLKSIRKATYHLEKMGIHRPDGHFLTVESALYLAEMGAALVLDQWGNALAIQQLYALLAQMGVSSMKYATFAQLSQAGYIVRPPNRAQCQADEPEQDFPVKLRVFHFPKELLNQFPTIRAVKNANLTEFKLQLPPVQSNLLPLLAGDETSESKLDLAKLSERIQQPEYQHLFGVIRRWDRNPWDQQRPRHWPSFHSLRSAENWKIYEQKKERLLRSSRGRREPRRRQREPSHDYELFNELGSSAQPIYRVLVVDGRFAPGRPNFAELQQMVCQTGSILLVATGTPNCLKFTQFQPENEHSLNVP